MIVGIGTDIIEVSRLAKAIENSRFLERYFTEAENAYFLLKNRNPQTIATSFAAKEAFSKALGTGFRGFSLTDVEVLRNNLGKPYINVYNNAARLVGDGIIHVSLTHIKEYASAYVIIEKV